MCILCNFSYTDASDITLHHIKGNLNEWMNKFKATWELSQVNTTWRASCWWDESSLRQSPAETDWKTPTVVRWWRAVLQILQRHVYWQLCCGRKWQNLSRTVCWWRVDAVDVASCWPSFAREHVDRADSFPWLTARTSWTLTVRVDVVRQAAEAARASAVRRRRFFPISSYNFSWNKWKLLSSKLKAQKIFR